MTISTAGVLYCRCDNYHRTCCNMSQFMNQNSVFVSAFVHACYLVHGANPETDPNDFVSSRTAGAISDGNDLQVFLCA